MARTAGRRTCETLASDPGQADQTGSAGGARKPGPGRQIVSQDNASASAESKVRPGPRPLTLRPHHRKTAEAGPEALSTVSLPNICGSPRLGLNALASTDQPFRSGPSPAGRIGLLVAVLPGSPGDAFGGGFGRLADGSGIAGCRRAGWAG